jgi:hypothetical protein
LLTRSPQAVATTMSTFAYEPVAAIRKTRRRTRLIVINRQNRNFKVEFGGVVHSAVSDARKRMKINHKETKEMKND